MPVMSNVANVIDRHVRSVVCHSFQGGVVQSNGEATDNTYITSTKQMALGAAQQKSDMLGKLFGTGQATQPVSQQVTPMQSKSASLIPNQQTLNDLKQQMNLNPRNAEQLYFSPDTPNSSYGIPSYSYNVTGIRTKGSNPYAGLINLLFK